MRKPTAAQLEVQRIMRDPILFIEKLVIKDKRGKLVRLQLTPEQRRIIRSLQTGHNVLVFKPRQIGSSTVVRAFMFWRWYTSKDPVSLGVMSHTDKSAMGMHEMARRFYDNLPKSMKRALRSDTNRTLVLEDTGASLSSWTAGGKGGLRSFSFTSLHISEYSFFTDASELMATAVASLNGGQLVVESTANHYNDPLHLEITKTEAGQADWDLLSFFWWEIGEYRASPPADFQRTQEEELLAIRYGLDDDQLQWRRKQVSLLGLPKFRREYPACIEDGFAQVGNAYYTEEDLQHVTPIATEATGEIVLQAVDKHDAYAIGVDTASGRGGDFSVAVVVSKMSCQPVAIYRSNTTDTMSFASKVYHLSKLYNSARVLVEAESYGLSIINELRHLGCNTLWKDPQTGRDWSTNAKTKLVMHEDLKAAISQGVINILDRVTLGELRALQLDDRGLAPNVPPNYPSHGDSVIALALAWQCLRAVPMPIKSELPDWVLKMRAMRAKRATPFGHSPSNTQFRNQKR